MTGPALSRRTFLGSAALAASLTAAGWSRAAAAGKLRVASVGVGGKGWSDVTEVAKSKQVEVVALCDIDESEKHLGRAVKRFTGAKVYTDWRKLMDDARSFDAVIVSTPDHMHAPVALPAMQLGKHVFCQKPLTHTVHEARQMQKAAAKHKLVTQMGNQIQSHSAYRTAVKLVHDGVIGKVKEVHSWQSGGLGWLLADDRPKGEDPVPKGVHWDLWLGVAPARPYKTKLYHSFNWRAWQDFSNGQLGDFGCHILDPVFMALGLGAATAVSAEAPPINREVWTKRSKVSYEFPGTARTAGKTLKLTWYDGAGHFPALEGLGVGKAKLPGSGSVLVGEKGSLLIPHVAMPRLFKGGEEARDKVAAVPEIDHYTGWADACRGEGKTGSHFGYSGPLTEAVLIGTIAIRLAGTALRWDSKELKFPGSEAATRLVTKKYRKGWEPKWPA
jgi:predicted dehydrogenase